MSQQSYSRNPAVSPLGIFAGACGLLLLISAFLPWITPKVALAAQYGSSSGLSVSSLAGGLAIIGGLAAAAMAIVRSSALRGWVHLLIGLTALVVLGLILFNGTLPLFSAAIKPVLGPGVGLFINGASALVLALAGLLEIGRRTPAGGSQRSTAWAAPQGYSQPPYQGYPQPAQGQGYQPPAQAGYAPPPYSAPPPAQGYPPPPQAQGYPPPAPPRVYAAPSPIPPPPSGQSTCPACGLPATPGQSWCGRCGAALAQAPAVKYCPSCSQANDPGARHCGSCGTAFTPSS